MFGGSVFYFWKNFKLLKHSKHYSDLLESLEKSRNFDIDYLPEIDALPREKPICVRANLEVEDVNDQNENQGKTEKVILKKVCFPQVEQEEGDQKVENFVLHLPMIFTKRSPSMYLVNEKGDSILLDVTKEKDFILHNTYISEDLNQIDPMEEAFASTFSNAMKKVEVIAKNNVDGSSKSVNVPKVFTMGLRDGDSYNFFGQAVKYDGSIPNPKSTPLMFKSKIITGEMKERVMRHLDNEFLRLTNLQKRNLFISGGLMVCCLVYSKYVKPALKERRLSKKGPN